MTILPTGSPLCHFLLIAAFTVTTSDTLAALSINDGVNGGQCSLAGTWDAASKTCTLNSDVADSVQIDSPSMTLDCGRHRIAAPAGNPGVVVPMGSDGVTIYECDPCRIAIVPNLVDDRRIGRLLTFGHELHRIRRHTPGG